MRDFTLHTYRSLLTAFQQAGYHFITFGEYCDKRSKGEALPEPYIILRHDVDLKAANSLRTAEVEHEYGIKASYYFRVVKASSQPDIISAIVSLGHEIGYHYEDMSIANGDTAKAITHFKTWLQYFRTYYPVKTICMHGAPTSQYDSRDIWKHIDYHTYGIIGEPYYDTDFSQTVYLTDTGRCWDGYKVSVRDKIEGYQDEWTKRGLVFHSTYDIIRWLNQSTTDGSNLPSLMITTHPQRWTDNHIQWFIELVLQKIKNCIKRILIWSKRY